MSGTLGADVPVVQGQHIAMVVEWNSYVAGAIQFNQFIFGTTYNYYDMYYVTDITATPGTWATGAQNNHPAFAMAYDDGTYVRGTGGVASTGISLSTGTTPDEVGNYFTVPVSCRVCGFWLCSDMDYACTLSLQNTSGTTLANVVTSPDYRQNVYRGILYYLFDSDPASYYDLTAGTYYRMVVTPSSASNITYLMSSLDQSLKRMNLDYVDIFYSHRFDPNTPLEETLQALVDIVRQGKALYVGISKYPYEAARFAYHYLKQRDVRCLLYQGRYNIFNREPEQEQILQQAKENGSGFIAFSPLAQGLLTNRYLQGIPDDSRIARGGFLKKEQLTNDVLQKIEQLNKMALERGQTLAEMALAWVLKDDLVTSVIIGASSVQQMKDNLKGLENCQFTAEELRLINRIIL